MNRVLLTVSGVMDPQRPEQARLGHGPRADYLEMARAFGADLLDPAGARALTGWFGRLIERLGGRFLLIAWACFGRRKSYDVIFTDGEQVGIPLAWMLKYLGGRERPRHLMIVHVLSVRKKLLLLDLFRLQAYVDTFFVYSSWQKRFIEEHCRVPDERVQLIPFMVDTCFFAPERVSLHEPVLPAADGPAVWAGSPSAQTAIAAPVICAVGLEYRDYPTLLSAVRDLPVHLVIAAASPWSKRPDTTAGQELPPNVTVRRFTQYELRQLYSDSLFLVMPLFDVNFQAGVTAILEAMAMGRAVICSRTPGQTDVVIGGETGIYVPPGDPGALRSAMERLIAHPEEAERMGRAGRRLVERVMELDLYVERLAGYVREAAKGGRPEPVIS